MSDYTDEMAIHTLGKHYLKLAPHSWDPTAWIHHNLINVHGFDANMVTESWGEVDESVKNGAKPYPERTPEYIETLNNLFTK